MVPVVKTLQDDHNTLLHYVLQDGDDGPMFESEDENEPPRKWSRSEPTLDKQPSPKMTGKAVTSSTDKVDSLMTGQSDGGRSHRDLRDQWNTPSDTAQVHNTHPPPRNTRVVGHTYM